MSDVITSRNNIITVWGKRTNKTSVHLSPFPVEIQCNAITSSFSPSTKHFNPFKTSHFPWNQKDGKTFQIERLLFKHITHNWKVKAMSLKNLSLFFDISILAPGRQTLCYFRHKP